ncbi:hypothetical protein NA57DRAFT_81250 [Rhizodiscina lignyota]|uniref:Uncharacterized protein n=1 Tax=Rhizodiscina lignyota TaxID=1504668 RepID=A0A9P4I1L2_9PEZI|nr:hypothetical protein NA57DRAFT_81250 [Rhizodiscina lignyota]
MVSEPDGTYHTTLEQNKNLRSALSAQGEHLRLTFINLTITPPTQSSPSSQRPDQRSGLAHDDRQQDLHGSSWPYVQYPAPLVPSDEASNIVRPPPLPYNTDQSQEGAHPLASIQSSKAPGSDAGSTRRRAISAHTSFASGISNEPVIAERHISAKPPEHFVPNLLQGSQSLQGRRWGGHGRLGASPYTPLQRQVSRHQTTVRRDMKHPSPSSEPPISPSSTSTLLGDFGFAPRDPPSVVYPSVLPVSHPLDSTEATPGVLSQALLPGSNASDTDVRRHQSDTSDPVSASQDADSPGRASFAQLGNKRRRFALDQSPQRQTPTPRATLPRTWSLSGRFHSSASSIFATPVRRLDRQRFPSFGEQRVPKTPALPSPVRAVAGPEDMDIVQESNDASISYPSDLFGTRRKGSTVLLARAAVAGPQSRPPPILDDDELLEPATWPRDSETPRLPQSEAVDPSSMLRLPAPSATQGALSTEDTGAAAGSDGSSPPANPMALEIKRNATIPLYAIRLGDELSQAVPFTCSQSLADSLHRHVRALIKGKDRRSRAMNWFRGGGTCLGMTAITKAKSQWPAESYARVACTTCLATNRPCIIRRLVEDMPVAVLLPLSDAHRSPAASPGTLDYYVKG